MAVTRCCGVRGVSVHKYSALELKTPGQCDGVRAAWLALLHAVPKPASPHSADVAHGFCSSSPCFSCGL